MVDEYLGAGKYAGKGNREAYLIALPPGEAADHEFRVAEKGDALVFDLDWPTPDDYDLEVYLKTASGELKQVGTSGELPGAKERVELTAPATGTYVARVVSFAAASPYTISASLLEERVVDRKVVPGKVERWTLTCERNDKVLQSVKVRVDRGRAALVDLRPCMRKW